MRYFAQNKLFRFLMIPVFMLAHLVCVCSGNAMPPSPEMPVAAHASAHDCCDGDEDSSPESSNSKSHKHDDNCPHCGDASTLQASVERDQAVAASAKLHLVTPILLTALSLDISTTSVSQSPFSYRSAHPPEPPNVLRLKCTLQI